MDSKKIIAALAGLILSALLGFAASKGVEIPCPTAVIQGQK